MGNDKNTLSEQQKQDLCKTAHDIVKLVANKPLKDSCDILETAIQLLKTLQKSGLQECLWTDALRYAQAFDANLRG